MKIFAGNSHVLLARQVCEFLGVPLSRATVRRFEDQEVFVEILESIRGEDVFVIQSTSHPANDHLMELLVLLDALKRGSARRVTACIPYFGYARQDRKTGPRTPISSKLVANLLSVAGANRILTLDLHAGQIQGFFDIPVDNLFVTPLFTRDIIAQFPDVHPLIVSPDVGGVVRARALAKRLEADLAIVDKRREKPGVSEVMHIIGDVRERTCILVDDIVDSAGTLCNAADALQAAGAKAVHGYVTHGVLSGKALERLKASALQSLVVTESIAPREDMSNHPKIRFLSLAPLLAESIRRISQEQSIADLFD